MATLAEQLGNNLKAALVDAEMTQAELARTMGLSEKHVSQMITGKSGALAMYDYAAFALGREWLIDLPYRRGQEDQQ